MAQPKVLEAEEYCMYFPLSELHGWGKRFAAQPKTIYSEVPLYVPSLHRTLRSAVWVIPNSSSISSAAFS